MKTRIFAGSRGYTILELLIVLTLTVIIAGGTLLNLFEFSARQSLDDSAKVTVSMLRNAQERASGQDEGSRWGIYFKDNASDRDIVALFQVDETLVASTTYTDVPGETVDQRTLARSITLTLPAGATTTLILFSKSTGLPNVSTTITFNTNRASADTRAVTISSSGKIDSQ